MSNATMVFGATMRRSEMWRLYRIRTASSVYELEVQGETSGSSRRVAVLTCVEPAARAGESHEDSSPRSGDASLFDGSPLDWIGKPLAVGTIRTSVLQAVEFITSSSTRTRSRTSFTSPAAGPGWTTSPPTSARPTTTTSPPATTAARSREPLPWSHFPLGEIEMMEAAASVLQTLCRRHDLPGAIAHDAVLQKRLKLALAQCGLMVETMTRRFGD
jgi:hypothetical protein